MKLRVTIAAMTLLSGCAAAGSDIRHPACDWLVSYPREMQARAAEELARHDVPALRRLVEDCGELRARLRASCGVE